MIRHYPDLTEVAGRRFAGSATVVLLAALHGSACAPDSGSAAAQNQRPLTLAASDVHVLGTSESIAQVQDLDILPDGSVWVLNSVEPFFIGFGPDGRVTATHGNAGGGPDEFGMPAGFVDGGFEDGIWVFDYRRNAFTRVSSPNGGASRFALPRDAVPPGSVVGGRDMLSQTVRTARLGSEIIVPRTRGSLSSGVASFRMAILGADLVAVDPNTGAARDVVALGDVLDDPTAGFVATDGGFPLWYRLWAVCGGNRIRAYDRARNQLRGFTGAGDEVDPIDLPPVRLTEVTPRQFARAVFGLRQAEVTGAVGPRLNAADSARILNQMIQGLKGDPAQLAAYLPRYVDFRCSEDGTVWMQAFDPEVGGLQGGPAWLRIEADASVQEVRLPERFDALRFTPSRIWGVQRDESDVASVAWIEIRRS
jgi:hypothetical protein